jgi:Transposase DDE domain
MTRFSPLLSHWHGQVKQLFTLLHGHQKKVLALFVLGAMRAESIVLSRVAEELLTETEAKVPSIERRLQRFLSNERLEVELVWEQFLAQVLPFWQGKEVTLILDLTPFEEYAQVVYVGLLQQARVLPLAWKVMPGQESWEQGQWEIVAHLFERVARLLGAADCTLIADRGLSCLTLIQLCHAHGWHYVLRIKQEEYLQRKRYGHFHDWQTGSQVVSHPGQSWFGTVRLWKEHEFETQMSAVWEAGYEQAWFLLSDRPAGRTIVKRYRWRMRVESTFQDMKRRGWQWESSHVRQLAHLERLLLVLFLAFWWLMHLAASCVHSGRRDRYDRHDRRDKGHLRLGRLYLRDIERGGYDGALRQCLPLRRHHQQWRFALRF